MKTSADPQFPGLSTALDTDAAKWLFSEQFSERGEPLDIHDVTVTDLRYDPGKRCEILYRLKVSDSGSSRSRRILLMGEMVRPGERVRPTPAALLKRYAGWDGAVLTSPELFLPGVRMHARAFPLDPDLPGLFDALDPKAMRRNLDRLWTDRRVRARSVTIEQLGYTPHARAAFAYEVLGEHRDTAEPELRRLIGKMHSRKDAARLFAGSWALWRAARGRVGLAPPVGYLPSTGMTLQERVPGERLGAMADSPAFAKLLRQTARYLAALHQLELPLPTRRKPQEEAGVVLRWSAVLREIRPDLAPRIERLRDLLMAELEARTTLSAPVHADFHHTNVLVSGDRVTLIDFDEMAHGDPLVDVGRFMASTRIPSLRTFGTVDALDDAREGFLAAYLQRNPSDERRVRLFEAASLLTAAASAFRIQRPNWREDVDLLVAEAERVFEKARSAVIPAPHPVGAYRPTADPDPWLEEPLYIRASLEPDVREVYGAEITRCRVARSSGDPDEYVLSLKGSRAGTRWSIVLRGRKRESGGEALVRRLRELREALSANPDAPLVPLPVGYLRALGLLVCEIPEGRRLSAMLGSDEGMDAAADLGLCLAHLHSVPLRPERTRTLASELGALRKRVAGLAVILPTLAARAEALREEVVRRLEKAPALRAPVLRTVHPHHVLVCGSRIALARVDDVRLSHPFIDTSDFAARVALVGIRSQRPAMAREVVERFRGAYEEVAGRSLAQAAGFDASALLRLACTRADREPDAGEAEGLLDLAESRLSA